MDAQEQQTERTQPTQAAEPQAAAWQASEQIGMEPAQAGTRNAVTSSERSAVLKPPTFWRRMKQGILPERTWLTEAMREAVPHLGGQTPRQWRRLLSHSNAHIRQEAQRAYHALPPPARCLLTAAAYIRAIEYACDVGFITALVAIIGVIVGGTHGFYVSVIVAAVFACTMTSHSRTEPRQALAKDLLDSAQDPGLVPFLALRLLSVRNGNRLRKMLGGRNLRNALVRLLPFV